MTCDITVGQVPVEEIFSAVCVVLSVLLFYILIVHYRRLKEGSKEYSKAKTVLDEIVFSFSKDLRQQEGRTQDIALQIERLEHENRMVKERMDSEMAEVNTGLASLNEGQENLRTTCETLRRDVASLASRQSDIPRKLDELKPFGEAATPTHSAAELPMPIRRERALAPLTETEVRILELLTSQGEKTAPQIQRVVELSREHTARLMKGLYLQGYVERRTDRIPYSYRLKKEMSSLLMGQRSET